MGVRYKLSLGASKEMQENKRRGKAEETAAKAKVSKRFPCDDSVLSHMVAIEPALRLGCPATILPDFSPAMELPAEAAADLVMVWDFFRLYGKV